MNTGEINGERGSSSPAEDEVSGPKERSGVFSRDILEMWLEKKFKQGADDPNPTGEVTILKSTAPEVEEQVDQGETHGSSN